MQIVIRAARRADLPHLLHIEHACFDTDRLSRRSFKRFLQEGPHALFVAAKHDVLLGYVLVLFRSGTSLARVYSIAVLPDARGQGVAGKLLGRAETCAQERRCLFLRLEVHIGNAAAIALYQKAGYRSFSRIKHYYEDGGDALQLEKRLQPAPATPPRDTPYYQQTTDFSCGPASLMMAMRQLDPNHPIGPMEELQIWREATTIFMTAGHGGCSPHGLALSARRRGFRPVLHINNADTPFIDSVRGEDKKRIVSLVHEGFMQEIAEMGIEVHHGLTEQGVLAILALKMPVVALISTWMLNRSKAPHWVYVAGSDAEFVYINDPDTPDAPWNASDYREAPIPVAGFLRMACFGRSKLRALLVIAPKDEADS